MKKFAVYQSYVPNFGLSPKAEGRYRLVARCKTNLVEDNTILEFAFETTNTIDENWFEVASDCFGYTDVCASRSTSVGDIVQIEDEAGTRNYLCDSVGWKLIEQPIALG